MIWEIPKINICVYITNKKKVINRNILLGFTTIKYVFDL